MAALVYVGIITRANLYWETAVGLFGACIGSPDLPPSVGRFRIHPSGPYLDDARNVLIDKYLSEPGTESTPWLLFLDSDVHSPNHDDPGHLNALIHELIAPGGVPLDGERFPVIAGVYRNPTVDGALKPVTYSWEPIDRGDGVTVDGFRQHTEAELHSLAPYTPPLHPTSSAVPQPLHPQITDVAAVGAGFLAIHRSLLLTMLDAFGYPQPWFCEPTINGIHNGEDMGFCTRLGNMGIPVLVHRGVQLAHYKAMIV